VAPRIRAQGYETAAFVSAYPLDSSFGLSRGFQTYDNDFEQERVAGATTDAAIKWLNQQGEKPIFLWVHYFDPHYPYAPPEDVRARFPDDPYRGEIAYMDEELGRLLTAWRGKISGREHRILIAGDHGEGLGEGGEAQHGRLLTQGTMRVPMIITGSNVETKTITEPVSLRRVAPTLARWAGLEVDFSLEAPEAELVMGEALKPYLQYGWSPQVMVIDGHQKLRLAADVQVFDLEVDPTARRPLDNKDKASRKALKALKDYNIPKNDGRVDHLSEEQRAKLASLGYTGASMGVANRDRPDPEALTHLFEAMDQGSDLFVSGDYSAAINAYEQVLTEDPNNLMITVRQAVSWSLLGNEAQALHYFKIAERLDGTSVDMRHYLAMHNSRFKHWEQAEEQFEYVLQRQPNKLQALIHLAHIKEQARELNEAALLLERAVAIDQSNPKHFNRLARLYMQQLQTEAAVTAFERVRDLDPVGFGDYLELGVCYMDLQRLDEAASSLDQVSENHPGYAMALFKRAQVAAQLQETDTRERITRAHREGNGFTRRMIAEEPLFKPYQ
jgi:tetratricopeptide (TPR) repeat protein